MSLEGTFVPAEKNRYGVDITIIGNVAYSADSKASTFTDPNSGLIKKIGDSGYLGSF